LTTSYLTTTQEHREYISQNRLNITELSNNRIKHIEDYLTDSSNNRIKNIKGDITDLSNKRIKNIEGDISI
jgi:hypothetical protein